MNSGDLCLYKGYQVTIFSLLFLWLRLLTSFSLNGVCWVNNRVNNAYRVMHIYPLRYDFCHIVVLFHTVCFHLYLAGGKALWWYSWWWISLVVICGEIWSAFNSGIPQYRVMIGASECLIALRWQLQSPNAMSIEGVGRASGGFWMVSPFPPPLFEWRSDVFSCHLRSTHSVNLLRRDVKIEIFYTKTKF
jgi:hypothetical protein